MKHSLAENMRRFHTKNLLLQEATGPVTLTSKDGAVSKGNIIKQQQEQRQGITYVTITIEFPPYTAPRDFYWSPGHDYLTQMVTRQNSVKPTVTQWYPDAALLARLNKEYPANT